jgi:AraC family transcriptional regulator
MINSKCDNDCLSTRRIKLSLLAMKFLSDVASQVENVRLPRPGEARIPQRCETNLLSAEKVSRWASLSVGWFSSCEEMTGGAVEFERPALALLEHGDATMDYLIGTRSSAENLRAGAMCLFVPEGPRLRRARWRPQATRQVKLELDLAALGEQGLLDRGRLMPSLRQDQHFHDPELAALLRCMVLEIDSGCLNGRLYADCLSLGVAQRILQTHGSNGTAGLERGKLPSAQLRMVKDLIAHDLAQDISVETLALAVGLSKAHFARLFKNTLGLTPHRYVLRARLDRAIELIRRSNTSLADVAALCGFASQSHLTGVFTKVFGIPPGDMRRRHRA